MSRRYVSSTIFSRVLPRALTLETWTMRGTPVAIAASSTRWVAPTFASYICGRSRAGMPMR